MSFFLGSWGMNRSAEQTNRPRTASRFTRFVCPALRFIPHEPRKKDTHSLNKSRNSCFIHLTNIDSRTYVTHNASLCMFPGVTVLHSVTNTSSGQPSRDIILNFPKINVAISIQATADVMNVMPVFADNRFKGII